MPKKMPFSKEEYFTMLDNMLAPIPVTPPGTSPHDELLAYIQKRRARIPPEQAIRKVNA